MRRIAETLAIRLAIATVAAVVFYAFLGDLPVYYYIIGAVLITPAVVFVLVRKHNWVQALFTGAAATMVMALVIGVPFIAYKSAMGDFANDSPSCDLCFDNTGGTIFASVLATLVAAIYAGVGGFVSSVITFIVRGTPPEDGSGGSVDLIDILARSARRFGVTRSSRVSQ